MSENIQSKIVELQTEAGGWTKESLAQLGISWPPPKGWKEHLETKPKQTTPLQKKWKPFREMEFRCRVCFATHTSYAQMEIGEHRLDCDSCREKTNHDVYESR